MNKEKLISTTFILIIVLAWIYYAFANFSDIAEQLSSLEHSYFLLAQLILLLLYFILVFNWQQGLSLLGVKTGFSSVARIWLLSNLAKYIPGAIWTPIGRGFYAWKQKIPISKVYLSWGLEIYLILLSATTVVLLSLLAFPLPAFREEFFIPFILFFLCLISPLLLGKKALNFFFGIIFFFGFMKKYEEKAKSFRESIVKINLVQVFPIFLSYFLMWMIYGLWLMVLIVSITGSKPDLFFSAFAWSLSWTLGYIVIFVPGGIGIREGALTLLLNSQGVPLASAALIALMTRFQHVVYDMLLVVPFSFVKKPEKDNN